MPQPGAFPACPPSQGAKPSIHNRSQSFAAEILELGKRMGRVRGYGSRAGARIKGGRHTPKKPNISKKGGNKTKEKQARGGRAPRCLQSSPTHGVGPASATGVPEVKCSGPVPAAPSWPERARAAGQAGQGTRGRTAAFSTHTLCNTTATTSVRPSALQRGRTDTHPHAGPAHPSDTGEIWDEVGGDTRLLVNHIGGAPRRVGVQQAVHGAEPGWVLLDREGSLHVDGVALVFEHAVA